MPPERDPFQVGLGSGNWRAPMQWEGRVSMFTLARWILWDPYALAWYADMYARQRWPRVVRQWRERQAAPQRVTRLYSQSELPFRSLVFDVMQLITLVWFSISVVLLLLIAYLGGDFGLVITTFIISVLGLVISGIIVFSVSTFTFEHAVASLWGLVVAVGIPLIAAGEISFWSVPEMQDAWVLLLTWSAIAVVLGMTLAGTVHLLERQRQEVFPIQIVTAVWAFVALFAMAWFVFLIPWRLERPSLLDTLPVWQLLVIGVIAGVIMWLSYVRILDWVMYAPRARTPDEDGYWTIPRTTRFAIPSIMRELAAQSASGADRLLDELWYLWRQSRQRGVVRRYLSVDDIPLADGESSVTRVARYYDSAFPWRPYEIRADVSGLNTWKYLLARLFPIEFSRLMVANFGFPPDYVSAALQYVPVDVLYRRVERTQVDGLDSPSLMLQGLILLEQGYFDAAAARFTLLKSEPLGAEMLAITQELQTLLTYVQTGMTASFPCATSWTNPLRPDSWRRIAELRQVLFWFRLLQQTESIGGQQDLASLVIERFGRLMTPRGPQPEANVISVIAGTWDRMIRTFQPVTPPPVDNPYRKRPGQIGLRWPEVDRPDAAAALLEPFETPGVATVMLTGLPGCGITTLLAALSAQGEVVLVTPRGIPDTPQTGKDFLTRVASAVAASVGAEIEASNADESELQTMIADLLVGWGEVGAQALLLAVDDVDLQRRFVVGRESLTDAIRALLRMAERMPQFNAIVAGHFVPVEIRSFIARFRQAEVVNMPLFQQEEIETLLNERSGTMTDTYVTDDAILKVLRRTGGHPYLVWLIGDSLIEDFNYELKRGNHHDPTFTRSTVRDVLRQRRVRDRVVETFGFLLDNATLADPDAKTLLTAISVHGTSASAAMILLDPTVAALLAARGATIAQVLQPFEQIGLLIRRPANFADPTWRFTIPMFADYLAQRPYA